ncbi:hypothetical protein P175DRAFT_0558334 [Aspergillus ochraceoroseus IBT 24754]|uniref:Pentacotripeptide-repeat region of PRORP domain-containing protein n=1 Tax=Aspergillus ochraceoroseus IBT 24754 TaxID=1392256 RepID=A0A2T5LV47_9EURO|nr:uncharacterized protein P175DRAFT_0558334 [Aspergillus ochraceoroseus IBT 24754]PTU20150.1 hypothetical protein P175DRAFT_0558334 [Aspergillus ochraceoroseus IBT 24754]
MQSQLTRRVFRAILNNEPLSSSQCRNRFLHTLRPYRSRKLRPSPSYVQQRGLFAFNITPPTAPPGSLLPSEAGLKPMRDLMRALKDKSRGPSNEVLAKAFRDFFLARTDDPGVITLFQAQLLCMTWEHLRSQEGLEPEEWQMVFAVENLEQVLYVLSEAKCLPEACEVVRKLAKFAFVELCGENETERDQVNRLAILAYINIQALNGNPHEARQVVEKFWPRLRKTSPSPWLTVMRGFAMIDDSRQIVRTAEKFVEYDTTFDPDSQEGLIQHLITQDLPVAVKRIYECPLSGGEEPNLSTKLAVIKYAVLKSDASWAQPIFESILNVPVSETIGVRLLWDAAGGKDASAIAERYKLFVAKDPHVATSLTSSCLDTLMEYANSINNPAMALELATLAPEWGIRPDPQTRLLHLEAQIQAGDVAEALKSLGELEDLDLTAPENLPLMNKLITLLCLSGQDDAIFNQVSSFLDPLFENNVRLEAETLAALTHMLLYRHDWEGVSELLRPRLGSYDAAERTKIRHSLTKFILDPNQESENVWEAYGLLQLAFPETGVKARTDIMTSFFKRDRSDQAFLVFGHMRQAENFAQRPKPDTYARCFQGLVRTQDLKHLELVHNMLKLDTEVDLSVRLLNWLMLAYSTCGKPEKSMEVFKDILKSEEGPSHRTISFFFKVCENHPNGTHEALKMMEKLKDIKIVVDRRLYVAYVEALGAQCEFELATEALEEMESVTGYRPAPSSLGLFYNAIPHQYWKDEVEKWAQERFPELWERLAGIERTEYEEGLKFNLSGNESTL